MPRFSESSTPLCAPRTRPIPFSLVVLCSVMLTYSTGPAAAQEQEITRVVAVVNDEPISVLDLAARVRLTVATLGAPEDEGEREVMVQEVLETLIDERPQGAGRRTPFRPNSRQ